MKSRLFLALFLASVSLFGRSIERMVTVQVVEERIDGKLFLYRYELIDGLKKEQWKINGKPADKQQFDTQVLEAEMQERRRDRENEYRARIADLEFKQKTKNRLTKKLLETTAQEIEQELAKFDRYELKSYLAFNANTIASQQEFEDLRSQVIIPARQLATGCNDSLALEQSYSMLKLIEEYPQKLHQMFEDTVQSAITTCDDSRQLKKLLELIS